MVDNLLTETFNLTEFHRLEKGNYSPLRSIEKLSRINIFVGPNNSGKSRLLRKIANNDKYKTEYGEETQKQLIRDINEFKSYFYDFANRKSPAQGKNPLQLGAAYIAQDEFWLVPRKMAIARTRLFEIIQLASLLRDLRKYENCNSLFLANGNPIEITSGQWIEYLENMGSKFFDRLSEYQDNYNLYKKIYIPTLRGLRGFKVSLEDILHPEVKELLNIGINRGKYREIKEDVYLNRTRNDYFKDMPSDFQVDDILDWSGFINKVREHNSSAHRRLWEVLTENNPIIKNTIEECSDYIFLSNNQKEKIIHRMNETLHNIYNNTDFSEIRLKGETLRLHKKVPGNLNKQGQRKFGRLLIEAIFKDEIARSGVDIITGLGFYDEIRDMLLGEQKEREIIREFEEFLGKNIFDKPVVLIPRMDSDVLNVKIGDLPDRRIYDLGDGMQSIIILTFPMFKHRDKSCWFFIEEPEMYIHPGYQRKLIDIMLSEGFNHQFFITTHSNHFLDLTFDYDNISIYSMSPVDSNKVENRSVENFAIEVVSTGDDVVLRQLGVRSSSVFLSNCTIWVEGITDRLYIRKYFEEYQKQKEKKKEKTYKEDTHFSFIEYAGSNITHWSFLNKEENPISYDRISRDILLITDEDGNSKLERKEELKKNLNDNYYCLKVREIENLLSSQVIIKALKAFKNEDGTGIILKDFEESWNESYKTEPLGRFIDSNIKTTRKKGEYKYATDSGTLKEKSDFCKKAIEFITYDNMTDESKDLTEKIYEFIKSCNQ
ncbi:MAG: AAA family ATPase [Candidatus Eremiobacteraeota bacterium]|nr:AAA family ATPase [Candidatus Eremiobacteraeota bacterium]